MSAAPLAPLETPVLKVSRPVAACSRCRNAKIKCDGKLPACSSCEKNGRAAECTSTNDQFARGKERSYVSTLETRLDRLQARLEEARARKPSVIDVPEDESATAAPSRRQSRQFNPNEPPTPTTSRLMKRKEVTAMDDLVSDFGFLSVNATARDFYGFTTAMSYARLILSACTKDELPQGMAKALPPRQNAAHLIQHYFDNVFVLLPSFDEGTFYAAVDNVYQVGFRYAEPLDHWNVRMVLAIASTSMSQQRGDPHYMEGIGHICAALEYAETVLHPGNISGVQALILLAEYAMLDPHHFDSWSLIGAASRVMTDLGLHQDPPKGAPMPRTKLELRRRVFHCIYSLDRSTSLVQTRAFSFSDDSTKVKIPFHKQPGSAPTSPDGNPNPGQHQWYNSHEHALDLVTLRQFQSKWYSDLFQSGRTPWEEPYPYMWDTCDAMRRWFDELSPNIPRHLLRFFEVDLIYSYVYVLSPSPRVPNIIPFAQRLIFEYCIRYAELMMDIVSDPTYTAPLTFYDAMRVYMTGRQFLDVLLHNMDLLLSGTVPPHPEVKPTTAPPPPMPVPNLPPGETVQRFNMVRSMTCITQVTTCLERLGVRFGYMSWHQRYRNEAAPLLDSLRQRLQEHDEAAPKRPGMWHGSSVGSNFSSNGSYTYHSPPQQVTQGTIGWPPQQPQSSPPVVRPASGYAEQQANNQQFDRQQAMPQQYNVQPQYTPQQQHQQPYQQPAQPQQQFTFNEPVYQQQQQYSAPPSQQFAAWAGYTGASAPVAEETPVPPKSAPQTTTMPQELSAEMPPPPRPESPRLPLARGGPARQMSLVSPTTEAGGPRLPSLAQLDSQGQLEFGRQGSYVGKRSSIFSGWEERLRQNAAARRTSMQDAAVDVLQATNPVAYHSLYETSNAGAPQQQAAPELPHFNFQETGQQPFAQPAPLPSAAQLEQQALQDLQQSGLQTPQQPPQQTYVGKGKAKDTSIHPPPAPPPPQQASSASKKKKKSEGARTAKHVQQAAQRPFLAPAAPNPNTTQAYTGKGKSRALDAVPPPIRIPPDSSGTGSTCPFCPGGFVFHHEIGFMCVVCSAMVYAPRNHRTLPDGGGCIELPDTGLPHPCEHQLQQQHHQQQQTMMGQGTAAQTHLEGFGYDPHEARQHGLFSFPGNVSGPVAPQHSGTEVEKRTGNWREQWRLGQPHLRATGLMEQIREWGEMELQKEREREGGAENMQPGPAVEGQVQQQQPASAAGAGRQPTLLEQVREWGDMERMERWRQIQEWGEYQVELEREQAGGAGNVQPGVPPQQQQQQQQQQGANAGQQQGEGEAEGRVHDGAGLFF